MKYFPGTELGLYAVVKKILFTENTSLEFNHITVNDLNKYKEWKLCPQYRYLSLRQREKLELVPVKNIKVKCVYMECKNNQKVISVPANILEHS